MNPLFNSEQITVADLQQLIDTSAEESSYLEFKSAGSLDKVENKKTEISKDVSAFANSGGGIIIYGMEEKEHKAYALSPIDGNVFSKEWLEQVINTRIHRRIEKLVVIPVRIESKIEKTIYLVNIPESSGAPHMAYDKYFYKRFNFEAQRMEEYEVRQAYSRQAKTELSIDEVLCQEAGRVGPPGRMSSANFILRFQVRNIGSSIENQYKLEISIPTNAYRYYHNNANEIKDYKIRDENGYTIFSIPNKSPLFQNELTTVATARINIHKQSGFDEIKEKPLKIRLYYTNGIKETDVYLLEVLRTSERRLDECIFES
jgi:hypothetical protein